MGSIVCLQVWIARWAINHYEESWDIETKRHYLRKMKRNAKVSTVALHRVEQETKMLSLRISCWRWNCGDVEPTRHVQ
eukprot:5217683-Amphidinium_carterae.1